MLGQTYILDCSPLRAIARRPSSRVSRFAWRPNFYQRIPPTPKTRSRGFQEIGLCVILSRRFSRRRSCHAQFLRTFSPEPQARLTTARFILFITHADPGNAFAVAKKLIARISCIFEIQTMYWERLHSNWIRGGSVHVYILHAYTLDDDDEIFFRHSRTLYSQFNCAFYS